MVTVSLGGVAEARVIIGTSDQPDIQSIELLSGSDKSTLAIKVKGVGLTSLGELTGSGDLKAFMGNRVDLQGDGINLDGTLRRLRLNDVSDGADISFESQLPAKLRLGRVAGSNINIDGPLRSFIALNVQNSSLCANDIKSMLITENLDAQVHITESDLGKLTVLQGDFDGSILVNGNVGKVHLRQGDLNGSLTAENDISRIVTPKGSITGVLKAGAAIKKITAWNLNQADIVALTGVNSIQVKNNMIDSMITIGYDNLSQPEHSAGANLSTEAYLGALIVKGTFSASTVAVGVAPDSQGSFVNGTANTNSGTIGKVIINQVNTDNQADPFGLVAQNDIAKLRVNQQKLTYDYQENDFYITVLNQ